MVRLPLERLIELQLQFNKRDVIPLCIKYLQNKEVYKRHDIAIYKIKQELINKYRTNLDDACLLKPR